MNTTKPYPPGTTITDLLLDQSIVRTNSHVRRLVQQGAVKLVTSENTPTKITDPLQPLNPGYLRIRIGKGFDVVVLITGN